MHWLPHCERPFHSCTSVCNIDVTIRACVMVIYALVHVTLLCGVVTSILHVKKQAQIHLAVGYISGGCEVSDVGSQPRPAGCSVVSS